MARRYLFILLAALALALVACGDDDEDQVRVADLDRYCELTNELDEAGSEDFAELEADPNATAEDFRELEAEVIGGLEAELEEIVAVAPDEIAADVEVLVADVQSRAEGAGGERDPAAAEAEQRVRAFEAENC